MGNCSCRCHALSSETQRRQDFFRSGWTDLRAFVIADLFQAGAWHLIVGPVIGSIVGGAAAILGVSINQQHNAGAGKLRPGN